MKVIKCYMPDVNFVITIPDEYYEQGYKKIFESIIKYEKTVDRNINIEYEVNKQLFDEYKDKINLSNGKIYNTFKNQTHKEFIEENAKYYLVDTEEYICVKYDDFNFKVLVQENNDSTLNWIVRIIREIYLREEEDKSYNFMHGTGVEINGKGILILGSSGSGKTTLAVKLLEYRKHKYFFSNDRMFINKEGYMNYFPLQMTFAMGTVNNNNNLDSYFRKTRILEKKKKIKYEDADNKTDCNVPLMDIANIFPCTDMKARTKINTILFPKIDLKCKETIIESMKKEEIIDMLLETDFTPDDIESLRNPWLRQRNISRDELLKIREEIIESVIKNVNIKKIVYGINTNAEDILNNL